MPAARRAVLFATLALTAGGCGSSDTQPVTPTTGGIEDLVDTQQGSIEFESHELGVKVRSLDQIESTPLPGPARKRCKPDGRSLVLGIERTKVRCFDIEAFGDYFDIALFDRFAQAEEQANLFGAGDRRVPAKGMPEETVCTTGIGDGPRSGIVYCDLIVDRRILLLTHSETGRSRELMRFAYDWLRSAG